MEHCLKITEYLPIVRPACIITQISPDHPMFIFNEDGVFRAWNSYMKGKGGKFLLNPRPETIQDITLNTEKISKFLRGTLLHSKGFSFASANIAYVQHNSFFAKLRKSTLQPDCFVSPLLYHANNTDVVGCSLIADLPELIYRDNIARTIDISEITEYFNQYMIEIEKKNDEFDPRTLKPQIMIKPKAAYIAEVIKQISDTHGLIVAIVDSSILYAIEEAWKELEKPPKPIKSFMKIPETPEKITLAEYTEKHALLDLMFGPFVHEYFVKYGIFPYTGHGMLGTADGFYETVKDSWRYYYGKHSSALGEHINLLVSARHAKGKTEDIEGKNKAKKMQTKSRAKSRRSKKVKETESEGSDFDN
ncbi:hypothetical protein SteCoe_12606 [Stentor coeruleus]|uniref:Uncharacterized protein n=1 Tax=Stentor coeruleus TaxID=5963 RepID=A0A1R2CAF1_9CILI|nr:hypothetical protein SteCoe_12606 [Stentor coeruleus]